MFSPISRPRSARAISVSLFFVLLGCSGTDIGYPYLSETASCPDTIAGTPAAGSGPAAAAVGGSTTGGAAGGATPPGSLTAGTSASASGGDAPAAGGSIASGGAPSTMPFPWPDAYDGGALPMPVDGHHNAGSSCMSSTCHGSKVPFVFGGTVYQLDGATGAPNVEVGISDGVLTVSGYSASNGNIWLPSSVGTIDFGSAQIAIRNANGERVKPAAAPRGAACNGGGCHGATMRLLEP